MHEVASEKVSVRKASMLAGDDGDDNSDGVKDDDDIHIMMQCLSVCLFVTKNDHFLKRSVCLFAMFYHHFFKSRK